MTNGSSSHLCWHRVCARPAVSQSADHAVVITTSRQSQPIVSDNNRYNICPKHGLTLLIIVSQQYRYVTVTALKSLIICHFWWRWNDKAESKLESLTKTIISETDGISDVSIPAPGPSSVQILSFSHCSKQVFCSGCLPSCCPICHQVSSDFRAILMPMV